MKNNSVKKILCTGAILGVIGVSGIMAYLTDTDNATNKFTIGKVDIELLEPTWDEALTKDEDGDGTPDGDQNKNEIPDYAEDITPNQVIAKDPKVKNVGINDAYIYLKVKIPAKKVITAEEDGTRIPASENPTQLFTYTKSANWTEIESAGESDENSYTYVYYYNEKVAPNDSTSTLFDTVTFANIVEGQDIETTTQLIDIKAYAIQADNLPAGTSIANAYDIYVNQNKN